MYMQLIAINGPHIVTLLAKSPITSGHYVQELMYDNEYKLA